MAESTFWATYPYHPSYSPYRWMGNCICWSCYCYPVRQSPRGGEFNRYFAQYDSAMLQRQTPSTDNTRALPRLGLSQHTDTSKSNTATLKCCYALRSYAGTIFSHDKLLA